MPLIMIIEAIMAMPRSWSARPARSSRSLRLVPDGGPEVGGLWSGLGCILGDGPARLPPPRARRCSRQERQQEKLMHCRERKVGPDEWLLNVYMNIFRHFN